MSRSVPFIVTTLVISGAAGLLLAQSAPAVQAPAAQAPTTPARGGQAPAGRQGGFISAPADPAVLLFREGWSRPMAQPMVQESLAKPVPHAAHLRQRRGGAQDDAPDEDYTYTGETQSNWAITVSDKTALWDLSRDGRMRIKTRNSGYRFTHVVIKTADGRFFASRGGERRVHRVDRNRLHPERSALAQSDDDRHADQRVQSASAQSARVPIIPTSRGTPDLTKVEEIGFSDLMAGGWIPATTRVNAFEVYGKKTTK
jgi:hypothetical protein